MFVYDNLELCLASVFAVGVLSHFAQRRRHRRRYLALRAACEMAVREVQESEAQPGAVVHWKELERELMRAYFPGYFVGLGRRVNTMLKLCAALALFALFLKGPIERGEAEARRAARVRARAAAVPAATPDRPPPRRAHDHSRVTSAP